MKKDALKIIKQHPNGSLIKRIRGEKIYYYLNYRESGKVVSAYLGTSDNVNFDFLSEKLSEAKHLIKYAKALNKFNQINNTKEQKRKADFLHDMFQKIQSIEFFDIPILVANAQTDEEKAFIKMISEFSIQLKQDAAIREHRF